MQSLLLGALTLLAACATTRLTERWRASDYAAHPQNILVLGLSPEEAQRHLFEDGFVQALAKTGVHAIQSYKVLPPGTDLTREKLSDLISQQGFDSALVTRLVDQGWTPQYFPGGPYPYAYPHAYAYPYAHPYFFYDYFFSVYPFMYTPGYWVAARYYRLETNLYETSGQARLIWSAVSESMSPPTLNRVMHDVQKLLIGQMQRDGILPL